jgi:hypothetical protein
MDPNSAELDAAQMARLPYVTTPPRDGRTVYLLPFVDRSSRFALPLVIADKIEVGFATPVSGPYMAETLQDAKTDIALPLLELIVNHLSFPSLLSAFARLERDLMNCAAFIEKYFVLHRYYRTTHDTAYVDVLAAEYEGALVNARSLYDQLQFVFRVLWEHVIQKGKRALPESFQDMAELSAADLRDKYRLPPPFVEFVTRSSPIFRAVRELRVSVVHKGASQQDFFCLPGGFCCIPQLDEALWEG